MKISMIAAELKKYREHNYYLPSSVRPILQLDPKAKILVIGPAPGMKAHETNIPWNDASGNRLRDWLGVSKNIFYDATKFALISMNFWYPGKNQAGSDNPPNLANAERWHRPLLQFLPHLKLTVLAGHHAQIYMLKGRAKSSMSETIKAWSEYLPDALVLPHPSWHNTKWLTTNLWFEREVLPESRRRIREVLDYMYKIKIKRVYEAQEKGDGVRILVDRLWPRGVKKENAHVDLWLKDIAPSDELRNFFKHDPDKWQDFKKMYLKELKSKNEWVQQIEKEAKKHNVTLLFAAKDEALNNAAVLRDYLEQR